jgi:protein phosphatase
MGTTMTAAALRGGTLFVAQVGDSRAYLIRDGVACQLTKDQSLMQKLVEAGEITPEQAEVSVRRNIILQALGPEGHVKVDLTHQALRRGDLLMLCSDGLSGQVRAEEIATMAASAPDVDAFARRLIDTANERGGPDNITAVVARFDGAALGAVTAEDAVGHQPYPLDPSEQFATPSDSLLAVDPPQPPGLANELAATAVAAAAGEVAERAVARDADVEAALAARRERVRPYYVALGIAAIIVALLSLWRFFRP